MTTAALTKTNWPVLAGVVTSASVATVGAGYLSAVGPGGATFIPECWIHASTGLWCPSCGGTRMAYALLNGDLAAAFTFNPLIFMMLPAVAFFSFRVSVWAVAPQSTMPTGLRFFTLRVAIAIPLVIVAFTVLRNVPVDVFSWMAP